MNVSPDAKYFVETATNALSTFLTPNWAKETDQKQPIFRYWDNLSWTLLQGNKDSPVSIGDRFEVKVSFSPVVRLDGHILVAFNKSNNPRVLREIEGVQSLITGAKAWYLIQQAKSALLSDQRVRLEITVVHECYNLYNGNHYKTIGQVLCDTHRLW